jgi:hypothetical protein
MTMTQENITEIVLDHLLAEIAATEVCSSPYSHFYLETAFPKSIYERILENLPAANAYGADNPRIHTREDGLVTRNILSLSPPALEGLPETQRMFWNEIAAALIDQRLKDAVFARLGKM